MCDLVVLQILRPFMLRRLKESVATELLTKLERVVHCGLSPYQAALQDLVGPNLRLLP
jgi:SNF2 family DNA or RNA helicase